MVSLRVGCEIGCNHHLPRLVRGIAGLCRMGYSSGHFAARPRGKSALRLEAPPAEELYIGQNPLGKHGLRRGNPGSQQQSSAARPWENLGEPPLTKSGWDV